MDVYYFYKYSLNSYALFMFVVILCEIILAVCFMVMMDKTSYDGIYIFFNLNFHSIWFKGRIK